MPAARTLINTCPGESCGRSCSSITIFFGSCSTAAIISVSSVVLARSEGEHFFPNAVVDADSFFKLLVSGSQRALSGIQDFCAVLCDCRTVYRVHDAVGHLLREIFAAKFAWIDRNEHLRTSRATPP